MVRRGRTERNPCPCVSSCGTAAARSLFFPDGVATCGVPHFGCIWPGRAGLRRDTRPTEAVDPHARRCAATPSSTATNCAAVQRVLVAQMDVDHPAPCQSYSVRFLVIRPHDQAARGRAPLPPPAFNAQCLFVPGPAASAETGEAPANTPSVLCLRRTLGASCVLRLRVALNVAGERLRDTEQAASWLTCTPGTHRVRCPSHAHHCVSAAQTGPLKLALISRR